MTEHPILFSPAMVRSILGNRKTQTRRVVKPQPSKNCAYPVRICDGWAWTDGSTVDYDYFPRDGKTLTCPYGVPGDQLWVREAWAVAPQYDALKGSELSPGDPEMFCLRYKSDAPYPVEFGRPRHAMFMPRWASRITLEITGVRVERVQAISEEDAREEGITGHDALVGQTENPWVTAYADLWDSINGKTRPWSSNPWVWVIEFKRRREGGQAV